MEASQLIGPAVVAAIVAGVITVIGMVVSSRTAKRLHLEKLAFDEKLAERKFEFDKEIAERKFSLDARLSDRKRQQDLAEEVLAGFCEIRDLMRAVRSPAGYEGEGKTRRREPGETDDIARQKDSYFAVLERFELRRETIARVMSREHRMAAWFGAEVEVPFRELHEALVRVTISARMLVMCAGDGTRRSDPPSWKKWESDIWWGVEDPDPIATKIDAVVARIDQICRPILSSR